MLSSLTVLSAFKLMSKNFNDRRSLNVPGGIDVIALRLKSNICTFLTDSKSDTSTDLIMFEEMLRILMFSTCFKEIVGKVVMKFSDKSNFRRVLAPTKTSLFIRANRLPDK